MTAEKKIYSPYAGEIIARDDAKESGLTFFFTGIPCKNNHIDRRLVSDGKCHECKRSAWERTRRKKGCPVFVFNKEKENAKSSGRKKYLDGSKCGNGHIAERWTHNSLCTECLKNNQKNPKNIARALKYNEQWRKINKHVVAALNKKNKSKRRALVVNADGKHGHKDIIKIGNMQKWKCACCKKNVKKSYHVDHIIPLSKGGSNWPRNLQILCSKCNLRKNAKDPIDFMQENGLLL